MSAPPFDLQKAIAEHRAAKAAAPDRPLATFASLAGGAVENAKTPSASAPPLAAFAALAWGEIENEISRGADAAERAAIAEHDGGLPRGWAEALARVELWEKPQGKSGDEWSDMVRKAWAFADRHGAMLEAAGWTFAEIFGEPRAWFDRRGAAWLEQGLLEAVALEISADAIRWRAPSGHVLTKWKAGRARGVTTGGAS